MAHLVASVSGVVLGGVAEVVGSNLARGKIFTASIGSVDSLYPPSLSINVYMYVYMPGVLIGYMAGPFVVKTLKRKTYKKSSLKPLGELLR